MNILKIYSSLSRFPLGKKIFSWLTCYQAPYFLSIHPLVDQLSETNCVIKMKKHRAILNHIGTVHAIAMCNACELAMGLNMQAGLPSTLRWIPKGMTVQYLKKAETDLRAVCEIPLIKSIRPGDNPVLVRVFDSKDQVVMTAEINVWISAKTH